MGRITSLGAALLAICVAAPGAHANIYKRVRADGLVEYSNVPEGDGWELMVKEETSPPEPSRRSVKVQTRKASYARHIREASRLYNLPESLLKAVIDVESSWNPSAVSSAGALGLMQLMPATAKEMGVDDPFDPRGNILGGTRYLRLMANKFAGDIILTLSAYNAGEGIVARRMRPPFRATMSYVEAVLRHYRRYRRESGD